MDNIKQLSNNNSIRKISNINLFEKDTNIKNTIKSLSDVPINNLTKISTSSSKSSFLSKFFLFLFFIFVIAVVIYVIYKFMNLYKFYSSLKDIYNKILDVSKSNSLDKIINKDKNDENNDENNDNDENDENDENDDLSKNNTKNEGDKNILKNTIEFTKEKSNTIKKNIDDIELPDAIETDFQKSGYCFVGKLNDVRYCSEVSARNKCMSGEIFPSMDLCINPNIK